MKIQMSERDVRKRARQLYSGDSSPISKDILGDEPMKIEWWLNHPQDESSNTLRQQAAVVLYTELGQQSAPVPTSNGFPARFDCNAGICLRPDKAIIKTFLRDGLVTHRMQGWQLIFELTNTGNSYLQTASILRC